MRMDIRGRRMLRLAFVVFMGGLAAATRPAGIGAQEAPIRWDGSLEHLSAHDPYAWQGTQPSGAARMSRHPVSSDGRYVVFGADIQNDPYPPSRAIFKRDRLTGETETFWGGTLEPPVVSANGKYIAFQSCDPWMRPDQAPICDIYIQGSTYYAFGPFLNASTTASGQLSNGPSEDPVFSPDGRFLVFFTRSTTLVLPGMPPGQLVMRDRDADGNGVFDELGPNRVKTEIISVSTGRAPGNNISGSAEISTDGQFIAFRSLASNLVPGDTNNAWDVFLRDRYGAGLTRRINVGWDGQQATPTVDSPAISMSASGDVVAFATDDTYLVNPPWQNLPDMNQGLDVVVYDRYANTLERINIGLWPGEQGNGQTYWPTLSENGQFVSLISTSSNAAPPPVTGPPAWPGRAHVYVYNRVTRQTARVSMNPDGSEPHADASNPMISGDGSIVLFNSVGGLAPTANGWNAIYGAAHLDISPAALTIPGRGGSATATVTAQRYVKWRADFEEYYSWWLYYDAPPFGTGNGSVSFSAYVNSDTTPRSETLVIGTRRLVVTQEAGLSLSAITPASGPATGGTVVTLTGTGFEPDMQVYFDGYWAWSEFVDSTTVRATTPPHEPGAAFVYVQSSDFRFGVLHEGFRYLDTTPPHITPYVDGTQAANGWYTSDVIVSWHVYDFESLVTPGTGCTTSSVTTDTTNGGYVTLTCTATSEGGSSTESVTIQRDATPPVAHIHKPEDTLYRLNSTELAYPMCWDSASGLASCTATRPSGQPLDTSTPGYHLFTVQATDVVGLASTSSRTYAVSSGVCDARPEGLIAWWPGDYDYRDVIGGHNGVLTNSQLPDFIGGISRGSMRFMFPDGKWVQVGDTPALELQSAMTLSAWVFSGGTNLIGVIAGREGEYLLGRHTDGRIRYSIATTSPGWGWVDTNVYVDQSVWTHLALTYDGSEIRLYKNGHVAYSSAASGEIGDAAPDMNDFRIGARQDPADPSEYAGNIDNVEVLGRAMTDAEIQTAFLAAPHGHCTDASALTLEPSPQRAAWGQTGTELSARLTRAGVPEPDTIVWFKFQGTSVGGYTTDANGFVLAPISLPANLAVGTYLNAVEARVDTNAVLSTSSATANFVVDRAATVMEWNTPLPIVFGTALNGAQLNARGYTDTGFNHGDLVYTMPWGSVPNAGTHTVSVTFTPWDTAHYATATASVTLVVNKANPMVEVYGYTIPYDGTAKSVTGRVIDNGNTYPGLLPLNISYSGSPDAPVNAGTYEVVGSYAGNGNYNAATGTTTLTIEKRTATVTATGGTFTYDGQPHAASVSAAGAGGASLTPVTVTYNESADVPVDAGSYAVAASYAGDSNNNAASATATLTIGKATPSVQWNQPSLIVYGTALGAAQLNASASVPGAFSYSPSAGTVLAAGAGQALSVTFTPADSVNHNGASAARAIDVAPAPLTVHASDASKRFGAPLPALSAAGSGFVNGNSMASLSGTLNLATSAASQSAVGAYPIVPSGVSSPNYGITFVNGTLSVIKGSVSVTILASPEPSGLDQPMTFTASVGAALPAAGVPAGTLSFFDGSTLLGTVAFGGGGAVLTTAGLPAGTRTFEARYNGDGSFEIGSGTASHVISNATMTPALSLTSSRNPSSVGQSVTLTANVSMPAGPVTGNVEFYSGATLLATRAIAAGKATFSTTTLAVGAHPILARYTGVGTTPPARSGVFVQTVGGSGWKNRSTTMALGSSGNPSALGTAVVFTASVTGSSSAMPTGRIVIMVNGQVVADQTATPVSGSTARVTISVPGLAHGKHSVTATYRGDPTYRGSNAQLAQTVN